MVIRHSFAVIGILAGVVSACSDPVGPCDADYACEMTGIDLAIIDARIIEGEQTGVDPVTNLPVYSPGLVTVEFTIVNRGNVVSEQQALSNGDTVPRLQPGAQFSTRVSNDYTGRYRAISSLVEDFDARRADLEDIRLVILQGDSTSESEDAEPGNDALTQELHLAVPVFTGSVSNISEIRQNQPFAVSAVVENVSLHGGDAPAVDIVLCMWMVHFGCRNGQWEYLSRTSAPALNAGSTLELDLPATLRVESMPYPETAYLANLLLCIVPSGHTGPFLPDGAVCLDQSEDLTYRPDYASCNPPVASVGQLLTLTERNCGEAAGDNRHFFLIAFDAQDGIAYDIDTDLQIYDADGNVVAGSSPMYLAGGRYYFVGFHENNAWVRISMSSGA